MALGLLLAAAVAGFAYFNDSVVRQTPFIGNFLPVSVFGLALALALGLNPALSRLGRSRRWPAALGPLSVREVCVIAALGLGACGWAGSGYFRTFLTVLVVPGDQQRANPGWVAAGVLSYVPGGDPRLAPGQLRGLSGVAVASAEAPSPLPEAAEARGGDFPDASAGVRAVDASGSLAAALGLLPEAQPAGPPPGPLAAAVAAQLGEADRLHLLELARSPAVSDTDASGVLRTLNRLIEAPGWVQALPPAALPPAARAALLEADALEDRRSKLLERQAEVLAAQTRARTPNAAANTDDDDGSPAQSADPADASALAALQAQLESLRAHGRSIEDPGGPAGALRTARSRAARAVLVAAAPAHVAAPPRGAEALPAGGRADPWVTDAALAGRPQAPGAGWSMGQLPWPLWAPALVRWGGATLLLAAMGLGLALLVHPQWTRRELLPYPIARLLEEAAEPSPATTATATTATVPGSRFRSATPDVLRRGTFWTGFALIAGIHLVGGLHAWFPAIPDISLSFNLNPLRALVPVASTVPQADGVFNARLYPSVAAFACFLTLSVGFSLGVSMLLWLALGAAFLASGAAFTDGFYGPGSGNLLRAGAYAGMSLVVLYTGRRFYTAAATRAVGLGRLLPHAGAPVDRSAVWGARLTVLGGLGAAAVLRDLGLDTLPALGFVVALAAVWVVMSRIVAETGCFYLQPGFLPVGIASGLLGDAALGPTGLILLGLASLLFLGDQRETLMPFLLHALRLADPPAGARGEARASGAPGEPIAPPCAPPRAARPGAGRFALWLALATAASFVLALGVTFWWQYNAGIDAADRWARLWMPVQPWDQLTRSVTGLAAEGRLAESVFAGGLERLGLVDPRPGAWAWFLGGLVAVSVCAFARLRVPGWPLHPVIFLVWGTPPMSRFAWSFLLGWLVKLCVIRLGGTQAYRAMRPFLVGVIAAELLSALLWIAVGAISYSLTGRTPASYTVFPG